MRVTVQDIINRLTEPAGFLESKVDRVTAGSADAVVHGIAVTFAASYSVLQRAVEAGANLVITHEGTFYSHQEEEYEGLESSPVLQDKLRLMELGNLTIYRFHDAPHRYVPDIMTQGLVQALDWEVYVDKHLPAAAIVTLPEEMSLPDIAEHVKRKLNLPYLRYAGDRSGICSRIGITVGYRGGGAHAIPLCLKESLDLLIAGEGPEWETPEYMGDAAAQGRGPSLLLLGHAASEEPGMACVADRLREFFPGIPIHYIPSGPLIRVI
ncbi:Putative GTP cyclohydrolase 1 type 2, NIF3 family [Paenibacillus sp. cl141a]|uniref:Nif3-like dinuclear metal center hexameric protein n=1 Tax=Paenibacillus sp. cl141a TaxID=1761877 RepID=UPI0008D5D577|nr:Nif3-like dinuclear metal center hexameric protein [Paenibacillus sp. cl141a]SEL70994.1 Putative GTP cyclohydrolase 1 type 2, NIF3 family [Paenibacillus sp. cl141a]